MGSERVGVECSGMETPPRLCYHALPSGQRAEEPLGMATPPLQAPGSVPFRWEVAPGMPRGAGHGDAEHQIGLRPVSACRRLEPPPRMALLPPTAWQVAKVADGEVDSAAKSTALEGPYYVLLRPPPSLFDGPSVMPRSNSLSSASFGRYPVGRDEGMTRRKVRAPAAWIWKRSAGKRDGGVSSMIRKKVAAAAAVSHDGEAVALTVDDGTEGGSCGQDDQQAAAATENVRITRFRRNRSLPNLSAAGNYLWGSIYGGLKQVVTAPWKKRTWKSASRR